MEKDKHRKSHWYPVTKGQIIQGLLADDWDRPRVYVVTIMAKPEAIHKRWPRILSAS